MSENGRVTHICSRLGCGYEGLWIPVLLIPSPRENPTQKRGRLFVDDQKICDEHKRELRVVDFLGVAGWKQLSAQIVAQGKTPPREEDLELEWSPLVKGKVS